MVRACRSVAAAMAVSFLLLSGEAWPDGATYDELPSGLASEVARLYYSALTVPGISDWGGSARASLLDVATLRYRDRLIDRASPISDAAALRHIERLSESDLALAHPGAVGQACAHPPIRARRVSLQCWGMGHGDRQ